MEQSKVLDKDESEAGLRIGVIGAGHVGLVCAAGLAHLGHTVACQDSDSERVSLLKRGDIPFYEPYLDELVSSNVTARRLFFCDDLSEMIGSSDVIFICVGTPPTADGDADITAVQDVVSQIAQSATGHKVVVTKSTVPLQTSEQLHRILNESSKGLSDSLEGQKEGVQGSQATFDVVSNPEFLREGSAVYDTFHPDRIVIGVDGGRGEDTLRRIYQPLLDGAFRCPIHRICPQAQMPHLVVGDMVSSELIKHASNAFLATKISFINAVSDLCDQLGADVDIVSRGMGLDPRIGDQFLSAGIGFGGYCFPKDLEAFYSIARRVGVDFQLLREVRNINQGRASVVLSKLKSTLGNLDGRHLGVLGLSFKPGTDDLRFSPALTIIRCLLEEGVVITVYDPQAMAAARQELDMVVYCSDAYEALKNAEGLLLLTDWPEFLMLDYRVCFHIMARPLILDGRNALDKRALIDLGFEYIGMGR